MYKSVSKLSQYVNYTEKNEQIVIKTNKLCFRSGLLPYNSITFCGLSMIGWKDLIIAIAFHANQQSDSDFWGRG